MLFAREYGALLRGEADYQLHWIYLLVRGAAAARPRGAAAAACPLPAQSALPAAHRRGRGAATSTIHRPASPRGRNCWRRPTPGVCTRHRSPRRAHASASAERLDELYETDRALDSRGRRDSPGAGSTLRRARARTPAARTIRSAAGPADAGARCLPCGHHCSPGARSDRVADAAREGLRRACGSGERPGVRALARRLARVRTRRDRGGGAGPRSCTRAAPGRSGRDVPQGARPPRARRDPTAPSSLFGRVIAARPVAPPVFLAARVRRTRRAARVVATIAPARSSPTATPAACSAPTRVHGSSPHVPSCGSRRTRLFARRVDRLSPRDRPIQRSCTRGRASEALDIDARPSST